MYETHSVKKVHQKYSNCHHKNMSDTADKICGLIIEGPGTGTRNRNRRYLHRI